MLSQHPVRDVAREEPLLGGSEELEEPGGDHGAEQPEHEQRESDQPDGAQVDVAAAPHGMESGPADQEGDDRPDGLARQKRIAASAPKASASMVALETTALDEFRRWHMACCRVTLSHTEKQA